MLSLQPDPQGHSYHPLGLSSTHEHQEVISLMLHQTPRPGRRQHGRGVGDRAGYCSPRACLINSYQNHKPWAAINSSGLGSSNLISPLPLLISNLSLGSPSRKLGFHFHCKTTSAPAANSTAHDHHFRHDETEVQRAEGNCPRHKSGEQLSQDSKPAFFNQPTWPPKNWEFTFPLQRLLPQP